MNRRPPSLEVRGTADVALRTEEYPDAAELQRDENPAGSTSPRSRLRPGAGLLRAMIYGLG